MKQYHDRRVKKPVLCAARLVPTLTSRILSSDLVTCHIKLCCRILMRLCPISLKGKLEEQPLLVIEFESNRGFLDPVQEARFLYTTPLDYCINIINKTISTQNSIH